VEELAQLEEVVSMELVAKLDLAELDLHVYLQM
jgi:hypothetical protein